MAGCRGHRSTAEHGGEDGKANVYKVYRKFVEEVSSSRGLGGSCVLICNKARAIEVVLS